MSEGNDENTLGPKGTKIILAVTFVLMAIFFAPVVLDKWQHARLMEDGVPAKARVTNIVATGSSYNDQPLVVVSLEVTPPQGKPFNAEVHTYISPVYLPRFQPGLTVDVRFDPEDLEDVALAIP